MREIEERRILLEKLIRAETPILETVEKLEPHDFDHVEGKGLVTLTRKIVVEVLERYLSGELSEKDLFHWADALELRDDVDFGEEYDASFGAASYRHNGLKKC